LFLGLGGTAGIILINIFRLSELAEDNLSGAAVPTRYMLLYHPAEGKAKICKVKSARVQHRTEKTIPLEAQFLLQNCAPIVILST
jgi:hypothetical protein